MANEKTENFIKELSDPQIEALMLLQMGIPEGAINAQTIQSLDERDLLTRIQYTSARSSLAIPGWALSEEGNKIVEELARRNREEERREAGIPKAEVKKASTKKKESKEDVEAD